MPGTRHIRASLLRTGTRPFQPSARLPVPPGEHHPQLGPKETPVEPATQCTPRRQVFDPVHQPRQAGPDLREFVDMTPGPVRPLQGDVHQSNRSRHLLQAHFPILTDQSQKAHRHSESGTGLPYRRQSKPAHPYPGRVDAVQVGRILMEVEECPDRSPDHAALLEDQRHIHEGNLPPPTPKCKKAGNPWGFPALDRSGNHFPSSWAWTPPAAGAIGCLAR